MRLAHICPFVGEHLGGSERYVHNISTMQSKEHDVHVYTTTRHLSRVGVSKKNGVTYHRFYSPAVIWNINPLNLMLSQLCKSDADVFHIHSYLYFTSNQAVLARLLKRGKALLQLHGGVGNPPYRTSLRRRWVKQIYDHSLGQFTIDKSDLIASVSKTDLETISSVYNVPTCKLCYVPNVVDTDQFSFSLRDAASKKTLLYVGDLERWKGVGSLIQWIREKRNWDGQSFRIRFVGQGSLYPSLARLRNELQKNGHPIEIDLLGQRKHSEIPEILKSADALVLPSFWEGMPTVVLEAMASGTPVISTRVGDIPTFVQHNHNGLLFENSVDSFRSAVFSLFENEELSQKIAKNARKMIEKEFSLERIASVINDLYFSLGQ
ncbi:MAG: glycosyltransferase family 1 protein [Candidatus Thorarchaeota archaeon]|nr:glycosyltransferase family 1 protein [Candidatus Thorarchaeota archaeon]